MEDRLNVILDLDNTIINSLEEYQRANLSPDFQSAFDYKDMLAYSLRIFARPNLQPFLDFLFENFNVSVFTAAEQEYALFIVNNFLLTKPNRKVHYIFFRYHVDMGVERFQGMKDLRLLFEVFQLPNFYPCNTVIIDDLEDVRLTNPDNTIQIKPFNVLINNQVNVDSMNDVDLQRVEGILSNLNKRFKSSKCPRMLYYGKHPNITSPFYV
jgi:hypothetical protein